MSSVKPLSCMVIGCVKSTAVCIQTIQSRPDLMKLRHVITSSDDSVNSDWVDINALLKESDTRITTLTSVNEHLTILDVIEKEQPDLLFVVGWSRLIPNAALDKVTKKAIGFHPAALPNNRGRHPIIWALNLGLEATASTLFELRKDADTGDILEQSEITIAPAENAGSLYQKILAELPQQIIAAASKIQRGEPVGIPQNELLASKWRKRSERDGRIDWRMSADAIDCLVRSLSWPYSGAEFIDQRGNVERIFRVEILEDPRASMEPGKIFESKNGTFCVKTWKSAVRVLEHTLADIPKEGSYL